MKHNETRKKRVHRYDEIEKRYKHMQASVQCIKSSTNAIHNSDEIFSIEM